MLNLIMFVKINPYAGGPYQQAVSFLPDTDQKSYELLNDTEFQIYGIEYLPSVRDHCTTEFD